MGVFRGLLLGELVSVAIFLWFVVETAIIIGVNPSYTLARFERGEGNAVHQAAEYASQSLKLASLTFAGLTFVVAQSTSSGTTTLINSIYLFAVAFGFFVVAYKLEVYAPVWRVCFTTQSRLFNFGLLTLVAGLVVYFDRSSPISPIPMWVVSVVVLGLHLREFSHDVRDYKSGNGVDDHTQRRLDDY